MESASLEQVFASYIGKEKTMEGKTFAKVAKDCGLLDKKLTATDIDLIFAKVKPKAERRITFEQFLKGLEHCAEKKGAAVEDVQSKVLAHGGPSFAGTKADAVKFHDDQSLYTGVHAKGGPTTVDQIAPTTSFGQMSLEEEKKEDKGAKKSKQGETTHEPAGSIQEVFLAYTAGGPEMDGKTFAKMAKDTKIISKTLTATDIDLIFAKIKDKAARKITFAQFEKGIHECAAKKKKSFDEVSAAICEVGGPVLHGTQAEKVKFHDDKSLYTGVHAKGGPSTVDAGSGMISDISQLCDRSAADVRGIKK